MNLILLTRDDFTGTHRAIIRGRRHRHIVAVLQADPDQTLKVGELDGRMGCGRIVRLSDSEVELDLLLDADPPPPPPLALVLALPRPKALRRILRSVAEFGVKQIHLVNAWRVDKSYWQSPSLRPESLKEQLLLGLEQAGDTILPEVTLHRRFRPFVEDRLPALAANRCALVAHPDSARACPSGMNTPVMLAIGPEGGFIPYEIEALSRCGFLPVHIGQRILRVETAVPALLGRITCC